MPPSATRSDTAAAPEPLDASRARRSSGASLLRRHAALVVAMSGFFVVALDAQIVNVALPGIGDDLGGGLAALQWVVTGYTLTFSSLLLLAGTLSDRVGARRAYGIGMGVFVIASAACGFAPTMPVLVAARIAQGVGAALITPTSLALIREAYSEPAQRARAVALWALGGSVAAAAGPLLGGVLAEWDWRVIFFVNLPAGAAALVVLRQVGVSDRLPRRFDVVGQVTALVALVGVTYGVIESGSSGWSDPGVRAAVGTGLIGAVLFLVSQRRSSHPMLPLDLFRARPVAVALTAASLTMAAFYGVVFVQSLYFQQVRGASALETGLLFLPMTALVAVLNPVAARVAITYGSRAPIVGGQVVMVAGLTGLAVAPVDAPLWVVALLMVPVGVGGSFTVPPLTSLLLESVPGDRAGTASGVLNTARQVGGSLGVAVSGSVIAHMAGFMPGLRATLVALALLVAMTGALSCLLPRGEGAR